MRISLMSITKVKDSLYLTLALLLIALFTSAAAISEPFPTFSRFIKDIAVQRDGSIMVLDDGRDQVVRLDKGGNLLWQVSLKLDSGKWSDAYTLTPSEKEPQNASKFTQSRRQMSSPTTKQNRETGHHWLGDYKGSYRSNIC